MKDNVEADVVYEETVWFIFNVCSYVFWKGKWEHFIINLKQKLPFLILFVFYLVCEWGKP